MSRLVKIVDNKYVQIEECRNPNICFNISEYDDFEDYCTLRETFDPFEMFYENQELKKKYENAVVDYEITMFEKEQLNSLVNSCQEGIRQLKKQVEDAKEELECVRCDLHNRASERDGREREINGYKTQQKEFILYLRHLSNWYSADGVKQGMVNEILQKYKEMLGDDK